MKEKPILLNGEMVRAILDDRKTKTRRPFKIQPCSSWKLAKILDDGRAVFDVAHGSIPAADVAFVKSPFGALGDLLWVRETWATHPLNAKAVRTKPSLLAADTKVYYRADENESHFVWRPSIHMPRWASRLTLRVLKVWVEQIQDISHDDCIKEGIAGTNLENVYSVAGNFLHRSYTGARYDYLHKQWLRSGAHFSEKDSFESLWNSIYAKRGFSWDSNCWVWVCEFEVMK